MNTVRPPSLAAALAVCLSGLAGQPGAAQQQPARPPVVTYDVDVPLVEVDAVVTDADGRVIRDLRAGDFEVLEDGRPQAIDRVQFVEIPITSAAARVATTPATGVRTNQQRFDGRLYVLLLDDVQTAASRAVRVRTAARAFVETRLEPGDLAAVVHVSGPVAGQDFTADRARLLASIDRFVGRKVGSETLNLIDEYNRSVLSTGRIPEAGRLRDPEDQARADDARRAFDAITRVAARLGAVRGRRKALLWFGEGVGYDMFDTARRSQAFTVFESARSAAAAASRANLVIYGMDARGLGGLGEETMQMSSPAPDPTTDLGARGLGRELVRSQDNLRQVSADTGGFAVVNSDEFGRAYERVVEESSAYYLLAYYPAAVKEGAFRKLEVRVRRPGASVRARRGYIFTRSPAAAARVGPRASLEDALQGPVPVSGLPMALHAVPFKGDGKKASVLVTVEFGAAAFAALDALDPDDARLEAAIVAVDPGGGVAATDSNTIDLRVREQTRRAMEVVGFRVLSRLDLPPGRYQVRAAGVLAATGAVGSVHADLDVPDFGASGLSISGLAVTSVVAGYTPTGRLDDRMRTVLPAPPTASRDFREDEAVALFAEVYEAGRVPRQPVAFRAEVRDPGGQLVLERDETRSAEQLGDAKGGFSLQIPLRGLAPAEYVLRIAARAGGSAVVSDEVRFAVWAVPAPEVAGRIVPVAKGAVSGVAEPRQEVVRTPAEWTRLWASLGLRQTAPPVAFDSTMVVAIFLGARPTAGYEIEVIGTRREREALIVEWRERVPEPGNPPADTTPFAIVGLPLHTGPVTFVSR